MKIQILKHIEEANEVKGLTVVIDVLRAFSVECFLFDKGIKSLIIARSKEEGLEYKKKNPNLILLGEKNGIKLPEYDLGNSPSQFANIDLKDKEICHKSTNGTAGVCTCINADEILTGALVNAEAIATYIKSKNPEYVTLVCTGWESGEDIEEDGFCAEYIKSLLEDNPMSEEEFNRRVEHLKIHGGSHFFIPELQTSFPTSDFYMCTQKNIFNFVLKATVEDNIIKVSKVSL